MNSRSTPLYLCQQVTDAENCWDDLVPVSLCDVVTGGDVQEETLVKACWDTSALHIRFECEDSHSVSGFENRDDPLYEQDVVEVFIDEEGTGKRYAEIVVSPNNVVYDAMITHDNEEDPLQFDVDIAWDMERLSTHVEVSGQRRVYTLVVPFSAFSAPPTVGTEWKINFYRIDEDVFGTRHYQAWSPTGFVNYHITDRFGTIRFVEG